MGEGKGYAVIIFERADPGRVVPFLNELERFSRERHMQLGRRLQIIEGDQAGRDGRSIENFIDSRIKMLQNVGLVVCVIGDKTTDNAKVLYPAIKVCLLSQPAHPEATEWPNTDRPFRFWIGSLRVRLAALEPHHLRHPNPVRAAGQDHGQTT